jgi:hypothetical protein
MIEIPSDFRIVERFQPTDSPAKVPSLYGATSRFARQVGGVIMNNFLDIVEDRWPAETFSVYAWNTELIPGTWPTPGVQWHADGNQCTSFLHTNAPHATEHIGCSLVYEGPTKETTTEFVVGNVRLSVEKALTGKKYSYEWWHKQIEMQIREGQITTEFPNSGDVYVHDHRAFHRGPKAKQYGKRLLLGASRFLGGIGLRLTGNDKVINIDHCFVPREDNSGWEMTDIKDL